MNYKIEQYCCIDRMYELNHTSEVGKEISTIVVNTIGVERVHKPDRYSFTFVVGKKFDPDTVLANIKESLSSTTTTEKCFCRCWWLKNGKKWSRRHVKSCPVHCRSNSKS